MQRRRLEAPDLLGQGKQAPADRLDAGIFILIVAWLVIALGGPFIAAVLIVSLGLQPALGALVLAVLLGAAFVLFRRPRGASTGSGEGSLLTALTELAGLPVLGAGLLFYVASALTLGVLFWATVLGFPGR